MEVLIDCSRAGIGTALIEPGELLKDQQKRCYHARRRKSYHRELVRTLEAVALGSIVRSFAVSLSPAEILMLLGLASLGTLLANA